MTIHNTARFLQGGGEMGKLIRGLDWSETPLGAVEQWPQSLRTSVSSCLNSRFPILLWWGKDLVKIYNDAYVPILGNKHPGALGKPGKEVWPEIWDIIGPMLEGVYLDGKATWSEDQLLLLERLGYPGEYYFTFSYSPIYDESGGIGGVLCVVTETTANVINARRLKTLQQLSSKLQHFRADQTGNMDAWFFSAASLVLAGNQYDFPCTISYRSAIRSLKAEAAGAEILPPQIDLDSGSPLAEICRQAIEQQKIIISTDPSLELSKMPTGIWRTTIQHAALIPIVKPDKTGVYGIIIAGLNPHLPADDGLTDFLTLVAEQIATGIANATALEEERKRVDALAEIDRAKTTFFSNISHEFRTPLTLMLGPLEELLGDRSIGAKNKENISLAYQNSLRLQKLVNNLLDFSRLEAGRIRVNYQETDIAALTAQLAGSFRSVVESSGMELLIHCPPIEQPVYIDRDMWEKIVFNLLSNAYKYTLEGRISVELEDQGERFVLKVTDTGIGIADQDIPHIFERFHQVKGSKGRSMEGTGIGLSMVKELVRILSGTVGVTSWPDKGSTFTVAIPTGKHHLVEQPIGTGTLSDEPAVAYLREATSWSDEAGRDNHDIGYAAGKPRILVADDNIEMRNYLLRLVSDEFDVRAVNNGRQAIECLQEWLPDLVLSDIMMPEVDGFELLAELKNSPGTAHIPVILLSARAGEEAIVEGIEKGADDYLTKPFSSRELLSKIRSQLKIKQVRRIAEQHLHNLFMQAPAGICVLAGSSLIYQLVNGKYQELFPGRKLLNRPLFEALPELVGQPLQSILSDVYLNGKAYRANEMMIPVADFEGGPTIDRYFNFNYLPRRDETGKIDGILVFVFEVTDIVVSRNELEKTRDNLKLAVAAARLGTFDMDLEKGTMEWDQRCRELFGISHQNEVSYEQDFVKGLHPDDRDRIINIINNVFIKSVSNGIYDVEYRTVGVEDHKERWIRAMGKAYFDENDKPLRFAGSVLEITELKLDEIRKNDFIGMVSHELKTPLTSLNALIQVLHGKAAKTDDKVQGELLNKAWNQVKKMTTLINGFLNTSRIDSGKIHLNKTDFNLNDLLQDIIEEARLTMANKFIFSPSESVSINGDKDKIGSVITNLLTNAVKYSANGKPVHIQCEIRGEHAVVGVRDEGIGIREKDAKRLFERFYRVENHESRHISGFGIGLYLSAEIIHRHNGKIWVESAVGAGSTFYFQLPVN
jgi:signal transduction histidine kinase/ActR/RegA family two-component response regulator